MHTTTNRRNLWPAAIAGFFILAAIFIVTFTAWAMRQREDLVSEDYYEREVRFQSRLDSMNRSQSFATPTVVTFEPARQAMVIALPTPQTRGATGSIHLYRPSDARLDRDVPLTLNAEGVQRLDGKELSAGLWKVRVQWTANGQEYFLDHPVVVPGAPVSDPARR